MRRLPLLVFIALALAVAVGLGTAVSPWASPHPDGLEKVAEDKGFLDDATSNRIQDDSPIPDYAFPGIEDERVATGLAGFVGTLGIFVLGVGIAWLLKRATRSRGPTDEATA
jgi:PDGLE domain